jgi:hypothetical protein
LNLNDEQLGFIWRFRKELSPGDMGRIMGTNAIPVKKAFLEIERGKRRRFPWSQQERLAREFMKTRCDSAILAFDFAFDACLDLPGQPTLRDRK